MLFWKDGSKNDSDNIKNRTFLLTNYALIHRCFSVYAMRIINLGSLTRKTID